MPTLIDELVVTLGIDGSNFKKEADSANRIIVNVSNTAVLQSKTLEEVLKRLQDQTNRRIRQTVDVGRTSAQQFGKFRMEIAGLFTTLATGFGLQKFVKDLTATEASTGRLAKNIGMSVQDLATFQEAAKRYGGSAEATGQSLAGLRQQFENYAIGGAAPAVDSLIKLGVSWSDASGKMRPMVGIMRDLNRAVQGMDKGRANVLLQAMGLDQGTIEVIELAPAKYDALLEKQRQLGVPTDQQVANADAFQKKLGDLKQAFDTLGRVVTDAAIGPLTHFTDEITKWVSSPENQKFISDQVVENIKGFGRFIEGVIGWIHEWHRAAVWIAEYISIRWLATMLLGLNPISAMIATIAAGFLALQKAADFFDPSKYSNNSIFWRFISKEDQLKYPGSPESRKARGEPEVDPNEMNPADPSTWFRTKQKIASTDMSDIQKGFLDTIAGPESQGRYDLKNGGSTFSGYDQFPKGIGPGGTSSASGRYQFTEDTWKDVSQKYGFTDFSPKNQDAAAWLLARDRYKAATGGDLEADLRAGKTKQVAAALGPTWPSLPGGSQSRQSQANFDAALGRNSTKPTDDELRKSLIGPDNDIWKDLSDRASKRPSILGSPLKDFMRDLDHRAVRPPSPPPKPDPSLNLFNMGPAQRDAAANDKIASASSIETNINGPITINTQARDADGIAKSLGGSLRKYTFVAQANTGLA